jgi:hypothetical protein
MAEGSDEPVLGAALAGGTIDGFGNVPLPASDAHSEGTQLEGAVSPVACVSDSSQPKRQAPSVASSHA